MYRYSQRTGWPISANTFSRLLEAKRLAGAKLLDLTVSNPTEVFDDYPHADIARAYHAIPNFSYRPDPFGENSARLAIAEYYAGRGIDLAPNRLILTASTSEAYSFLFKLLCNSDDEVLVPVPSYPLFGYLAALESVRIVPYRLRYDGSWYIDLASLERSISPRTRAIIAVNPNNPTGSFVKPEEALKIFQLSEENRLPIISDEVFMDYAFGARMGPLQALVGNNSVLKFSLNGLSKSAGMPQMKLAWIAIGGPDQDRDDSRKRLELIADTYLSVSTPVQRALPDLLRIGNGIQHQIARRLEHNLNTLRGAIGNVPANLLHVEGGWSAIVQLPAVRSDEAWVKLFLNDFNLVLQPGYFFDLESGAHVVMSLITPPETFASGLEILIRALDH